MLFLTDLLEEKYEIPTVLAAVPAGLRRNARSGSLRRRGCGERRFPWARRKGQTPMLMREEAHEHVRLELEVSIEDDKHNVFLCPPTLRHHNVAEDGTFALLRLY